MKRMSTRLKCINFHTKVHIPHVSDSVLEELRDPAYRAPCAAILRERTSKCYHSMTKAWFLTTLACHRSLAWHASMTGPCKLLAKALGTDLLPWDDFDMSRSIWWFGVYFVNSVAWPGEFTPNLSRSVEYIFYTVQFSQGWAGQGLHCPFSAPASLGQPCCQSW